MMAADAADGGVFFPNDDSGDPSGFNEDLTFYPKWDQSQKSTVNCVVVRDDEEGTREARGDGVVLNNREGRSTRRSIKVECAASLAVRSDQPETKQDVFVDGNGEIWVVKRILGRDDYLQTVLCIHNDDRVIRTKNRVG